MEMSNKTENKKGFIVAMLVLGSMCGFVEVVIKGVLHQWGLHLSGLLIGLDCFLIGIGLAIYNNPLMIIGLGLITCICKQLVVPVLGISFMCEANSCLAVMLEYGSLSGIAAFTLNSMKKNTGSRVLTGGAGVFLGSSIYYFAGMRVNPCPYMLSFNVAGGFTAFIAREGLIWALFAAALFPLGWSAGERLSEKTFILIKENIHLFYLKSALTTIICLTASVIFISMQG
jgi:hypothetical protein